MITKEYLEKLDKAYEAGNPLVEDYEYDALKIEYLLQGNEDYLRTSVKNAEVNHLTPLLSLKNVSSEKELFKYLNSLGKMIRDYYLTLKFDGLTGEAIYDHGMLVELSLRGDGHRGESISHHAKNINIPKFIPIKERFSIVGEIILSKDLFEVAKKVYSYTNIRNAAAGLVRRKSIHNEVMLDFMPFSVGNLQIPTVKELQELFNKLDLEFKYTEVTEFKDIMRFEQLMDNYKYPLDGVVLRLKDFNEYENLGTTSIYPKGAVSYKFREIAKVTTTANVVFQVAASGVITPVLEVEPVTIKDTTIKRVTLHNIEYFKKLNPGIGDRVKIIKSKEVSPQVVGIKRTQADRVELPENCPECFTKTKFINGKLYCVNENCGGKKGKQLLHVCNKKALNIPLGEITCDKLGIKLDSPFAILRITEKELEDVGVGAANTYKVLSRIDDITEKISLDRVIYAMNILKVANTTAKLLAREFKSLDNFLNATTEQLMSIKGIGKVIADNIINYIKTANLDLTYIKTLNIVHEETEFIGNFVITGTFDIPREEVIDKIEKLGGVVKTAMSRKIDYLLVGANPGEAKVNYAKTHNIQIFTTHNIEIDDNN